MLSIAAVAEGDQRNKKTTSKSLAVFTGDISPIYFHSFESTQKPFVCKDFSLVKFNSLLSAVLAGPRDMLVLITFAYHTHTKKMK